MRGDFEKRLTGGHPNSLGNTLEVVEAVFADPARFEDLFACYFSEDEVVRLRTSNAVKRVCAENRALLIPFLDRLLEEVAGIDQASAQWTLAQLFDMYEADMSVRQRKRAQAIMQNNLACHSDWIVLKNSMDTLCRWAEKDAALKTWLMSHLARLAKDNRKAVSGRACKHLAALQNA